MILLSPSLLGHWDLNVLLSILGVELSVSPVFSRSRPLLTLAPFVVSGLLVSAPSLPSLRPRKFRSESARFMISITLAYSVPGARFVPQLPRRRPKSSEDFGFEFVRHLYFSLCLLLTIYLMSSMQSTPLDILMGSEVQSDIKHSKFSVRVYVGVDLRGAYVFPSPKSEGSPSVAIL